MLLTGCAYENSPHLHPTWSCTLKSSQSCVQRIWNCIKPALMILLWSRLASTCVVQSILEEQWNGGKVKGMELGQSVLVVICSDEILQWQLQALYAAVPCTARLLASWQSTNLLADMANEMNRLAMWRDYFKEELDIWLKVECMKGVNVTHTTPCTHHSTHLKCLLS